MNPSGNGAGNYGLPSAAEMQAIQEAANQMHQLAMLQYLHQANPTSFIEQLQMQAANSSLTQMHQLANQAWQNGTRTNNQVSTMEEVRQQQQLVLQLLQLQQQLHLNPVTGQFSQQNIPQANTMAAHREQFQHQMQVMEQMRQNMEQARHTTQSDSQRQQLLAMEQLRMQAQQQQQHQLWEMQNRAQPPMEPKMTEKGSREIIKLWPVEWRAAMQKERDSEKKKRLFHGYLREWEQMKMSMGIPFGNGAMGHGGAGQGESATEGPATVETGIADLSLSSPSMEE